MTDKTRICNKNLLIFRCYYKKKILFNGKTASIPNEITGQKLADNQRQKKKELGGMYPELLQIKLSLVNNLH